MPINDSQLFQAAILIVEDDEANAVYLTEVLEQAGFCNISHVKDGEAGLSAVHASVPDIVILDINMPKVNGYEFCTAVRKQEPLKHMPILVQSGAIDDNKLTKAFLSGATDFIHKPVNNEELLARLCVHLENQMMMRELAHFRSRLERELEQARSTQESLLPTQHALDALAKQFNLGVATYFQPSSEIGGDLYLVMPLDDVRVAVSVVDFTGHGINAALNIFRLHTMLYSINISEHSPGELLSYINGKLHKLLPTGQFATMFYAILNSHTRTLDYAMAGAPAPIIKSKRGAKFIDETGLPLGTREATGYDTHRLQLKKEDILLLYSDGLTETPSGGSAYLSDNALLKQVEKAAANADVLLKDLVSNRYERAGDAVPDDITLLAVQC